VIESVGVVTELLTTRMALPPAAVTTPDGDTVKVVNVGPVPEIIFPRFGEVDELTLVLSVCPAAKAAVAKKQVASDTQPKIKRMMPALELSQARK
jgi:hypothetical protein